MKGTNAVGVPTNEELREWIATAHSTMFKANDATRFLNVRLANALTEYNRRCAELQAEADEAPGLVERLEKQIDGWQGELARRRSRAQPRKSGQASVANKAARVEALVKRILLSGSGNTAEERVASKTDAIKAGEELKGLI